VSNAGSDEPLAPPSPELTLSHLDSLPTLAPVAAKLLQVTLDDESSARDIVSVLRHDQSLTARILSLANSAACGARGKVTTVDRAAALLGFKAVRSIALAVKVFECFDGATEPGGQRHFDRKEFWKHTLGVACTARRLASDWPQLNIDREEAFVAGLLHDLGKVALDAVFPRAYQRIAAQARAGRCDIVDCERAALHVDHTVAGRYLAKRWGLPRCLEDVIWLHNKPAETLSGSTEFATLVAVVQVANVFAREQHIGHSGDCAPICEPAARLAERLGLATADSAPLLDAEAVRREVVEYASLLGLDQEMPEVVYLRSLGRANAELGRLNAELLTANHRLSIRARYFDAITQFQRRLSVLSDLATVVGAIPDAALTALERSLVVAFGVHDQREACELSWVDSEGGRGGRATQRLTSEIRAWLAQPGSLADAPLAPAPGPVRALLTSAAIARGAGECWLVPIVRGSAIVGGIVFFSRHDEHAERAQELEELRSFVAELGLALARANAQAAARRLSEELAESSRRLQQMQAELFRTRNLRHVAKVAQGADQLLRDPLSVILGHAQMLRKATKSANMRRKLTQIEAAVQKCSEILTDLRESAEGAAPQRSEVDLTELLTEVRDDWLKRSEMPVSRFRVEVPAHGAGEERPRLLVDRAQVRVVLDEVVKNAVAAVAENDGSIAVQTRVGIVLPPRPTPTLGGAPLEPARQRWIEISVRDTGGGIDPAIGPHVFDPFFPPQAAGRGRGMGLARALRIVEAHGGRIWFDSQPGRGTTFYVRLPQVAGE
jgi:putative nucleotidyltransferase with HDIG domain